MIHESYEPSPRSSLFNRDRRSAARISHISDSAKIHTCGWAGGRDHDDGDGARRNGRGTRIEDTLCRKQRGQKNKEKVTARFSKGGNARRRKRWRISRDGNGRAGKGLEICIEILRCRNTRKDDDARTEGKNEIEKRKGVYSAVSVVATGAPFPSPIDFPRFFTPPCGASSGRVLRYTW